MSTIITTSTDPNVLRIDLAEMYYDKIPEDLIYQKCANLRGKDWSPLPDQIVTHKMFGMGAWQRRGETTPFAVDAPGPAGTKTTSYDDYALRAVFTERLIDFQRKDIMQMVVNDIRNGYHLRRNLHVASVYDDYATGSLFTGFDGLSLGNASHTSTVGAVRSNIVSAPFSYQGVQDSITRHRNLRSERNAAAPILMGGGPIYVIIPNNMEMEAYRLFDFAATLEPTTDRNAINVLNKFEWVPVRNHHLTSTTQAFMFVGEERGINLVDHKPLTPSTTPDPQGEHGVIHDGRGRWAIHTDRWEPGVVMTG